MDGPVKEDKPAGSLGKAFDGTNRFARRAMAQLGEQIDGIKDFAASRVDGVGEFAQKTSAQLADQTSDLKCRATDVIETWQSKDPDPYELATVEYNAAFTDMNDRGVSLLRQRERSTDVIELVEFLVNSIANTPKSFATDFREIEVHKDEFLDAEEFARRDLAAARRSAGSAGAGVAVGTAVATIAPTAALWVATTFGTASTGTAISTLSGAVATKAALAWLGGGALAAGGGGAAAGSAVLALAGPIGWTVAGATVLASVVLFTKSKRDNLGDKQAALTALKRNTARVRAVDGLLGDLLARTAALREALLKSYSEALTMLGSDFLALSGTQKSQLGALVNSAKACAVLLSERIEHDDDGE